MTNYEEMTSKELKALAKAKHVRNWWTKNKAQLVDDLMEIETEEMKEELKSEGFNKKEVEEIIAGVDCGRTLDYMMQKVREKASNSSIETTSEETKQNVKPQIKRANLKLTELTYQGETKSIRAWAEELNMPWPTLYDRVNRNGWTVEDAIEIPMGQRRKKVR